MLRKVGVIAGSPVDTQMGVDVLIKKGLKASAYPAAKAASVGLQYMCYN